MTSGHWAVCTIVNVFSHTIKSCQHIEKTASPAGRGHEPNMIDPSFKKQIVFSPAHAVEKKGTHEDDTRRMLISPR